MDLSAAFRAMCVEYSRGGPSGHLNQNTNGGNAYNNGAFSASSSNEGDSDRALTYHEFIAAAMMNRLLIYTAKGR